MATFRLRDAGKVGVVTDIPPSELPPGAWTDAVNVRFARGKISKIGGYSLLQNKTAIGDQTPLHVAKLPIRTNTYFYATDKYIYSIVNNDSYDSSQPSSPTNSPTYRYNITPAPIAGYPGRITPSYDSFGVTRNAIFYDIKPDINWSSTVISTKLVFNTEDQIPVGQLSDDPKDLLQPIPGWAVPFGDPDNPDAGKKVYWSAKGIVSYKDFLVAFNMIEGDSKTYALNYPTRVRWSDLALNNGLPSNWYIDEGDVTSGTQNEASLGGFNDLMEATSPIVDTMPLRDWNIIYTNTETYVMNFIGGDEVFSFTKLFNDSGLLNRGCVAEFDGYHVCVTQDDVIIHDGSQKSSIVSGVIKDRLLAEIGSINHKACRVYANPNDKEIWITYPFQNSNTLTLPPDTWYSNRAAVYNWEFKTWTFTELPNIYSAVVSSVVDEDETQRWSGIYGGTFTTNTDWDLYNRAWDVKNNGMGVQHFYCASADHCLYLMDYSDYQRPITFPDPVNAPESHTVVANPVVRTVTREGIDFDEQEEQIGRVKTIRTVYPMISGEGAFTITVGGQHTLSGVTDFKQPQTYTIGTSHKIDTFDTHRYHTMIFQNTGPSNWSFSGYDVDYVVQGTR